MPFSFSEKRVSRALEIERLGRETRLKNVMHVLPKHFFAVPAIELLGTCVPELKHAVEAAHHNGFGCQFEQIGPFTQQIFKLFAASHVEERANRSSDAAVFTKQRSGTCKQMPRVTLSAPNLQFHAP